MTDVTIRKITDADKKAVIKIFYESFNAQSARVGEEQSPNDAEWIEEVESRMDIPGSVGLVAVTKDNDEEVMGVVFMNYMDDIASGGPFAVRSDKQSGGVMRKLVGALADHAKELKVKQLRLLQTLSNRVSFSLYAKLDFVPAIHVMWSSGYLKDDAMKQVDSNIDVHAVTTEDEVQQCDTLFQECCGYSRINHIRKQALDKSYNHLPFLIAMDKTTNKAVGYWSRPMIHGHMVAKTDAVFKQIYVDMCKRLKEIKHEHGPTSLISHDNYNCLRWLLDNGQRIGSHMTLMYRDVCEHVEYQAPRYIYCSSVEM